MQGYVAVSWEARKGPTNRAFSVNSAKTDLVSLYDESLQVQGKEAIMKNCLTRALSSVAVKKGVQIPDTEIISIFLNFTLYYLLE